MSRGRLCSYAPANHICHVPTRRCHRGQYGPVPSPPTVVSVRNIHPVRTRHDGRGASPMTPTRCERRHSPDSVHLCRHFCESRKTVSTRPLCQRRHQNRRLRECERLCSRIWAASSHRLSADTRHSRPVHSEDQVSVGHHIHIHPHRAPAAYAIDRNVVTIKPANCCATAHTIHRDETSAADVDPIVVHPKRIAHDRFRGRRAAHVRGADKYDSNWQWNFSIPMKRRARSAYGWIAGPIIASSDPTSRRQEASRE